MPSSWSGACARESYWALLEPGHSLPFNTGGKTTPGPDPASKPGAENEYRIDLTPTEKLELAMRIEEASGVRVGRPKIEEEYSINSDEYEQKCAEKKVPELGEFNSPKERESSAIAAKSVGWKRETYRKAKAVVKSGDRVAVLVCSIIEICGSFTGFGKFANFGKIL